MKKTPEPKFFVRTSIVSYEEGWCVRIRVEAPGTRESLTPNIVIGPFASQQEAEANGHKVAKLIRKTMKQEKN